MRGMTVITALALILAVPVWAQHSGGHAGGVGGGRGGGFSGGLGGGFVGHVGFSGGRGSFSGGHVVGGHSFSGMRGPSGPVISRGFTHLPSSRATLSRRPFLHDGFRDSSLRDRAFHDHRFRDSRFRYGPFHDHRFREDAFRKDQFGEDEFGEDEFSEHQFRNNCFGVGCWSFGSPWWYGGIDPWWWDSGSSYDEDYERDRALAAEMNARNLEEQQMLRHAQADRDQDAYARPPRREQEKPEREAAAILPATVLVFRDQRKQEVQNYAIVGQTFWAFAPQHQKIPLSDLDLAATTKANDDRGVTFRVPAANEAQ